MRKLLALVLLVSCKTTVLPPEDPDGDGFAGTDDCNEADPAINAGGIEACNLLDDDCDGLVDEDREIGASWYTDADGDGYGDPDDSIVACTAPPGTVHDASDCDDADASVNPEAIEACTDAIDRNCDGTASGEDADEDGFSACIDCDDDDEDTFPGADETCDGDDDNCDGDVDEDAIDAKTWYVDRDDDGHGSDDLTSTGCLASPGFVSSEDDCDDLDGDAFPGADERCDGRDDDCDGSADEDAIDAPTWYEDADDDGHGDLGTATDDCEPPSGHVGLGDDCDDTDFSVFPGAPEPDCTDPTDRNCDGKTGYADADKDGYAACKDCNDTVASIRPGTSEVCNGKDDDCDGPIDESATDAKTWYGDADGDGHGGKAFTVVACTAPAGFVAGGGDCDDLDASAYPGGTETCDGRDDDCDGVPDDAAIDTKSWYADADKDGHGNKNAPTSACTAPANTVSSKDDCNDAAAAVYPGAPETDCADPVDYNCDGKTGYVDADADGWAACEDCDDTKKLVNDVTLFYADSDGDGHGNKAYSEAACTAPAGYVTSGDDCVDTDKTVYPTATEACDGVDNDCDGAVGPKESDADKDGFLPCDTDCDDTIAAINPTATELCDKADNDCDGATDENGAYGATTYFADTDKDGFGDKTSTVQACALPANYVTDATDCHDKVATAFPGSHATEVPLDKVDTDCDGLDVCTDFTCDGRPDLFAGIHYSHLTGTGYLQNSPILVNVAGAISASGTQFALPTQGAWAADAADYNKDGYLDLVVNSYFDNTSYTTNAPIYYGSATGYSAAARVLVPVVGNLLPHFEDMNGDGWVDLAVNSWYDGDYFTTSYVYYGGASGYSVASRFAFATKGPHDMAWGDVNGDGYPEMAVNNYYDGTTATHTVDVYTGSATGYTAAGRVSVPNNATLDIALSDYDKDGYEDLFVTLAPGGVRIYKGSAAGLVTGTSTLVATNRVYKLDLQDINGDGWVDLLAPAYTDATTGAYVSTSYLYYGSSTGFSTASRASLATTGAIDAEAGDFNGDGRPDLAFPGYYDGDYAALFSVHYGAPSGYSATAKTEWVTNGARRVLVDDFNEDGFDDLVIAEYIGAAGTWTGTWSSYVYWGSVVGINPTNRTVIGGPGVHAIFAPPGPDVADD